MVAVAGPIFCVATPILGADAAREETVLTQSELDSWLEADAAAVSTPRRDAEQDIGVPPRSTRHRGWVVEGTIGALGHLGHMRNVSPTSPWFRLQVGYELFDWWMLYGEGDLALSSTEYASGPLAQRGYALFGFGIGTRLAWQAFDDVSFFVQGGAGLSSVNHDVLSSFGYPEADRLRPYVGGMLGVEWFQISPHYALSLMGGVRDYLRNFDRQGGVREPIAWMGGLGLRYAP